MESAGILRAKRWMLRNTTAGGSTEIDITFTGGGVPVTGDWTGSGRTLPGWFSAGAWSLRNSWTTGGADSSFTFGDATGTPVVWGRIE